MFENLEDYAAELKNYVVALERRETMKLVKIKLSYEVAEHYEFEYLWKYLPHKLPLIKEGGLLDDFTGQLGSIPIALDPVPSDDGVYTAVVP